jgi:hypothetical protein
MRRRRRLAWPEKESWWWLEGLTGGSRWHRGDVGGRIKLVRLLEQKIVAERKELEVVIPDVGVTDW